MPGLPLRALLGELSTLLLEGQNAVPSAALGRSYGFARPQLSHVLAELAETKSPQVCRTYSIGKSSLKRFLRKY